MKIALGIAICLLLLVPSLPGQLRPRLVADIPFDFYLGDTAFAKGTYELSVISPSQGVLLQSTKDTRISGVATAFAGESRKGSEDVPLFVFAKYDNDHAFLKFANWGYDTGRAIQMPKSRTEKQLDTAKLVTENRIETLTVLARAR